MSKRFLHTIREDVTGHVVWEISRIILVAISTWLLTFVGSRSIASAVGSVAPYKTHLAIAAASLFALTMVTLLLRLDKYRPHFPRLHFDYQLLEHEITYDHIDKYRMTYTRRKRIRALRSGLDRYHDKYHWSGRGKCELKSGIRGQKVTLTERKSVWQYYEIRFPKTLNKGEIIETLVIWDLEDTEQVSLPFLSSTIEEPTRHLKMTLKLPEILEVDSVVEEVSSYIGAKTPFTSEIKELSHGQVEWVIDNPKLLHHYQLKWEW
jgi:hypothetical protein